MLARFIYPPVTGSLGRITRVGVLVAFCFHAAVGEVAHVTSGPLCVSPMRINFKSLPMARCEVLYFVIALRTCADGKRTQHH